MKGDTFDFEAACGAIRSHVIAKNYNLNHTSVKTMILKSSVESRTSQDIDTLQV